MTIQKLFRRFSVRLRMARWVAEEDDDDVASQLENVRVAVAQFCLANHVDFDRVEKKFADVNVIEESDGGARRGLTNCWRAISPASLDDLAGSRATAWD